MPIPAGLAAAGKLVGLLGPSVGKFFGAKKASDSLSQSPGEITAQFEQLKKDMPQYGVGSAWNQYLAMSKQDPAADMQRQIAAEQEASSIGALKAGGAKALLGGLGASQRAAAQNRMGIEADSQARQQSALGQFAGVQQRAQDMQTRVGQNLEASQFEALRGAEQLNRQLEASKNLAMGDLAGSVMGQFGQGHLEDMFGGVDLSGLKGMFGGNKRAKSARDSANAFAGTVTDQQMADLQTSIPGFYRKDGGMTTPGKFSHESNPIDIIKDGAKIGEMTGGEAILNPEQQKKASKQSPYFRKLMREFAMRDRK